MCTVTYIPRGNGSFILTSNRDEQPVRSPKDISVVEGTNRLLFPRDSGAGGTWIAASDTERAICILNGAFEPHVRRPTYRLSRGIMALEFFDFAKAPHFFEQFDFNGIEPFTMIIYEQGELYELRWDEQQRHIKLLDTVGFYIWSSATLYDPAVRAKREKWFANWLERQTCFELSDVLDFHLTAGEGDSWNDVVMNRGFVQTVSITSIIKNSDIVQMLYHDLLHKERKEAGIALNKNLIGIIE